MGIAQWIIDKNDNITEIAIQVRDDWQGEGLGKFLLARLVEIALSYNIKQLKADVFCDNTVMNKVFENGTIPYKRKGEFGVYSYIFNLK